MSQKKWTIIGGVAVLAIGGLIAFGVLQSGDKVADNASVPGDTTSQESSTESPESRAESAEAPAAEPEGSSADPLPRGPALPSLTGKDLVSGETIDIAKQANGKPLIIQMWASWCHVCDESGGEVKQFVDDRQDVVYIGVDVQDERDSGQAFAKKHGWTHTSISDDGSFAQTFGLRGTPTYLFVHADGKIAGQTVGDPGLEGLNRIADRLVADS